MNALKQLGRMKVAAVPPIAERSGRETSLLMCTKGNGHNVRCEGEWEQESRDIQSEVVSYASSAVDERI